MKYLRFTLLLGTLAFTAFPVFADGPGDGDPPPSGPQPPVTKSSTGSTTPAVITILLSYLGL